MATSRAPFEAVGISVRVTVVLRVFCIFFLRLQNKRESDRSSERSDLIKVTQGHTAGPEARSPEAPAALMRERGSAWQGPCGERARVVTASSFLGFPVVQRKN